LAQLARLPPAVRHNAGVTLPRMRHGRQLILATIVALIAVVLLAYYFGHR